MAEPLLIAQNAATSCFLLPALANRHGLITGATGTGKTVTLQTLAEGFSRMGVPVFMADVKGDLTGISQVGHIGEKMAAVLQERGLALPTAQALLRLAPALLAAGQAVSAEHAMPRYVRDKVAKTTAERAAEKAAIAAIASTTGSSDEARP